MSASRFSPSPSQQEALDFWGQGLVIIAGAGSGKTTTIIEKCKKLIERNPSAKLIAISFTERSASDLRQRLGGFADLSQHWVHTIHGFCARLIQEVRPIDQRLYSQEEADERWQQLLRRFWLRTGLDGEAPEQKALEILLKGEGRRGLDSLLTRVRGLQGTPLQKVLAESDREHERALALLAGPLIEQWKRAQLDEGFLCFEDLETESLRLLENPLISKEFQDRFDLVLVDEFQDTNAIQGKIIERITRPGLQNLCIVGDPKQSIYRFRDADVRVFDSFSKRVSKQVNLDWNFRSRPGILQFCNAVCAPLFQASELEYGPLVAKREADPECVLPVEYFTDMDPGSLSLQISAYVEHSGVKYGSIAILLKKVRGNEGWLEALQKHGIPFVLGSGGVFWKNAWVIEWVALLSAWSDATETLDAVTALRSPWIAVPDTVLDQWIADKAPCLLSAWMADMHGTEIVQALSGLWSRKGEVRPGEVLLALLEASTVQSEAARVLMGLWHRVEELSKKGKNFKQIVKIIKREVRDETRSKEVPPPLGEGAVSVLTVHASKGLEFEHVILVDFKSKPDRAQPAPNLFWDPEKGAALAVRDEQGERQKDAPLERERRAWEAHQELAEEKRVFYVALTRARERLWCVFPPGESLKRKVEQPYLESFWRGWVEACPGIESLWRPGKRVPPDFETKKREPVFTQERWSSPTKHPVTVRTPRLGVSELSKKFAVVAVSQAPKDLESFVQTGERFNAREQGTKLHALFEREDWTGVQEFEVWVPGITQWAQKTRFWNAEIVERAWNELAFEVPWRGEVIVGAIDRLVQYRDGSYELVDYKLLSKETSEGELKSRYLAQLALYAHAVRVLQSEIANNLRVTLLAMGPAGVREWDWTDGVTRVFE